VHVVDDTTEYRIAVNVKSQLAPSEVEYLVDDDFRHPLTASLRGRAPGFTGLASKPADGGLDFIRGNLFDRTRMRPLPMNLPGPDDDLNDQLDRVVQAAVAERTRWSTPSASGGGRKTACATRSSGSCPGNGIHDIHMNQGNSGQFVNDDGVWQDGGLLVYFPSVDRWTASLPEVPVAELAHRRHHRAHDRHAGAGAGARRAAGARAVARPAGRTRPANPHRGRARQPARRRSRAPRR
jgi:uncharacterized protein YukJ